MSRFAPPVRPRPRTFTALATLGTLTAVAMLASPTVASAAQPSDEIPHTTVHYSLSELASDSGTQALYKRIVKAAEEVCPRYDSRDLAAYADSRACQQEAVARAIVQVGNARLAAVYAHASMRRG